MSAVDTGRSPDGSGYSPKGGAAKASPAEPSIPNAARFYGDFSHVDPHALGMARPGENVRFLGCNGYPAELKEALSWFAPNEVLTVEACNISGWSSSYRFVGRSRLWNTVMFAPASAIEAATAGETGTGSTVGKSAVPLAGDAQPSSLPPSSGALNGQ